LVTGGTNGIGAATAERFYAEGAKPRGRAGAPEDTGEDRHLKPHRNEYRLEDGHYPNQIDGFGEMIAKLPSVRVGEASEIASTARYFIGQVGAHYRGGSQDGWRPHAYLTRKTAVLHQGTDLAKWESRRGDRPGRSDRLRGCVPRAADRRRCGSRLRLCAWSLPGYRPYIAISSTRYLSASIKRFWITAIRNR
jgi:hypothetical protein